MPSRKSELLVVEYGGTARSGKGTIVNHLEKTYDGVTSDETGADYRAVTKALLERGDLEEGMTDEHIQRILAGTTFELIASLAADRKALVEEFGLDSLYTPTVSELASSVSPIPLVREAVKTGFATRIEAVRDQTEYEVLAVDGRNLKEVVNKVEGTRLIMRTFTQCLPAQAAIRECLRSGIDPLSPEGQEIHAGIVRRNEKDANRDIDPVQTDVDALHYWHDVPLVQETLDSFADSRHIDKIRKASPAIRFEGQRDPKKFTLIQQRYPRMKCSRPQTKCLRRRSIQAGTYNTIEYFKNLEMQRS